MRLATVYSRAQLGIEAPQVTVEVDLSNGLPGISIVGLPETAVKESKDRVPAALLNAQFHFPDRRITVSLAPADLPKEGGRFDLPIALGILAASGQLNDEKLGGYEFLGELSLGGALRPIRGVLPAALQARASNRCLVVPEENGPEAALVRNSRVLTAMSLLEVTAHLENGKSLPVPVAEKTSSSIFYPDLNAVYGQHQARRALELAAAGTHNMLMCGPPGCGKTLLASCLPGVLPPMTDSEALETAIVASLSGRKIDLSRWWQRRFRSPHHTVSSIALAGGGSRPKPGEISLAHNGVLFLDELPEFDRRALEVLREPMESGQIIISRVARSARFPANFQLIAAMNPCPCGYFGDESGRCRCPAGRINNYLSRISGPLLDRIDIHIKMPRTSIKKLIGHTTAPECSEAVRCRIIAARQKQMDRGGVTNARLEHDQLKIYCDLDADCRKLLAAADEKMQLSVRAHNGILKVARTIADLDDCEKIQIAHLGEALALRPGSIDVQPRY